MDQNYAAIQSVEQLLSRLVQIPSVNPDGDPGTDQVGEKAVAKWVGGYLEWCGASVCYDEVLPERPNVIGQFGESRPNALRLLFAPHTDTVSVAGMTIEPFGGEIRDGRVWGRGASDTKGTMAAMLWAFRELKDQICELSDLQVSFVGLMSEETGQDGAKDFADRYGADYDFSVVGEPTNLDIVYKSKGCCWLRLSAQGKAVHGSTPERGDNAVRKLIKTVVPLVEHLEAVLPEYADPDMGAPTVNWGQMHGGHRTNIVPDHAEAFLDVRETPALAEAGGVQKLVADYLQQMGVDDQIETKCVGYAGPLSTDPDHVVIHALESLGSQLTTAPWFCDAGWLAKGGIPSIACGPGDIAQAHTKDEFIEVDALRAGADRYRDLILALSEAQPH
ncbi:MAG: M20/M25/M40 family metallo-hydrolase [Verrucomicrobiota bacterium]